MALDEGQWKIRGLTLGPGTVYDVLDSSNPFTSQVSAEQTGPRAWAHGSWSGVEWQAERVVPINLLIDVGADDVSAVLEARHALAAAFRSTHTDIPLTFALGGREYLLWGRPRMVDPTMNLLGVGKSWVRAAFVCPDPLIYSATESTFGPVTLPTWVGGLRVPFTAPVSIDATRTGGEEDITVAGQAEVGVVLRIDGPVPQPRITVIGPDGEATTLRMALTLPSGQFLEIDTAARTVLLGGDPAASRRNQMVGDFPLLRRGVSTVRFAASNNLAGGTLSGRWRDGWW